VTAASHAGSARRLIELLDFDLLILDVMMPGEDGFSLTRAIRKRGPMPVLILTARGLPDDRIEGLSLGADDYLAKPFEPQELLLRIEAVLRRAGPKPGGPRELALGDCSFDLERAELWRDGEAVRLTESEAVLLKTLALNAHAPVDRYDLAREESEAGGRAVDVQVTRLRRKIESDPREPRFIQTVRHRGYVLRPGL
jgi:two-component system phosphate regulon response regulator OmpR